MINSTTILLPTWKELLEGLELRVKLMPRDVRTRWNSTYAMLSFALEYRKAIENLTSDRKNDLRQFELSDNEWEIVQELSTTLKVGPCGSTFQLRLLTLGPAAPHFRTLLTLSFLFHRFLRMLLNSFHAQRPTLQQLSRQWTISTHSSLILLRLTAT